MHKPKSIVPRFTRLFMPLLLLPVLFSLLFCTTGAASEGSDLLKTDTLHIIQATDLHYLAPSLTDHGPLFERVIANGDGKVMDYIDEIADAFIDTVLVSDCDALILTGDLAFNGEKTSHEVLAGKLSALTEAGIPVFVLPGNHDLYYPLAASYSGETYTLVSSVSADEFAAIYHACGFDQALSRDSASLSYMAKLSDRLYLLMIDTNTVEEPGSIREETLTWAEAQLKKAQADGAQVISGSHQTLLTHNAMFRGGFVINNQDKLQALYETYGVHLNLCGHMHLQHYAFNENETLTDIVTSAISITPAHYADLMMTSDRDTLSVQYRTNELDVAAWAKKQGRSEENLLNFTAYSHDFFRTNSYEKTCSQLTESNPELTDAQRSQMAAFLSDINVNYFTGHLDQVNWDEEAARLWGSSTGGEMYSMYLKSIEPELSKDFNSLTHTFAAG